ncbi:helix-turn-helix domain-containing protein [Prescottella agglutinans]|uniref:Transcriptional regulator with XRE-family HTH domain n=1 Tax=Prescottella agglutinans TaxID=1644129 RepID=A0ABT6MFU4_9NOCA|nr:helix-turn-helix transcriptional regulator [Prescottella agglutinans]MDH6283147.1 transcriptional regulator with XRE-family HTH domain [Prescottella agglutinans]
MSREFEWPEDWANALREAGLVDPTRIENPSLNALRDATGISTATLSKIVRGQYGARGTNADNIEKIAEALDTSPAVVAGWVNRAWGAERPRELPSEAKFLTDRQWACVVETIKAFAETQRLAEPAASPTSVRGARRAHTRKSHDQ